MNSAAASDGLLVILRDTGTARDAVPVYQRHPDADSVDSVLSRGFSGRLLRLYRLQQQFLHARGGSPPEPAYLLLSRNQGGFPRYGFFLGEEDKQHAGYVDLHERSGTTGRFGSMDQIFPHELAHVIVRQLAGEPDVPVLRQVHAIGVATDPVMAFQEGFAEHVQILAVDDPDAMAATKSLTADRRRWDRAQRLSAEYRRELEARWAPATRRRMTFPLWFGGTEQTMRYYAVKANLFAFEVPLPASLLTPRRLYAAYLLQNFLPGSPSAGPKTPWRAFQCEGVVAAFFHRWATHEGLRQNWQDASLYARFGVGPGDLDPLENVYLKLFVVFADHTPQDTPSMIAAYRSTFPDEAHWIDALVAEVFHADSLPVMESHWLLNPAFSVGTSLYDQFRSAPHPHVFDLNAASLVDLLALPGVDRPVAESLLAAVPVGELDDISGVPLPVQQHIEAARFSSEISQQQLEELEWSLDLRTILMPYVRRALLFLFLTAFLGALLHRLVGRGRWWASTLKGVGVAVFGLGLAWFVGGPPAAVALVVPVSLFGVPEALWRLLRRRAPALAARGIVAWLLACVPAALCVQPLW